jgi:hypothetical protein
MLSSIEAHGSVSAQIPPYILRREIFSMGDWQLQQDEAKAFPFPQARLHDPVSEGEDDTRACSAAAAVPSLDADPSAIREQLHVLIDTCCDRFSGNDVLDLTLSLLGDRVTVDDAPRYIYTFARQQGYEIPPYPLAGCGEIKAFFAEYGVRNVPEWYERIGISPEAYDELQNKRLLVVRNHAGRRKAFLIEDEKKLDGSAALRLADSILAFVSSNVSAGRNDLTLF